MGKKRTIVGYPLVPDLLGDMNLLRGFPETPADFDPNGQWTNTYRIMTCHGYREDGNEDIGLLRLSKSPTSHLITGMDIFPTVCDFAGVPLPEIMRGRSLRPLLTKPDSARDDAVVCESNSNRGRMVRTSRYKYIAYAKDEVDQLFDMHEDPGETRNLSADPQYASVLKEHRERLIEWERQLVVAPDLKYANAWWRKG